MKEYLELLKDVIESGTDRTDRTGVGTRSVFGRQVRFDMKAGFPIMTTKKVPFKSVATELCWFLKGNTNVEYLRKHGCTIWDEWAKEDGSLGPIYGHQWRDFNSAGIDQIDNLIKGIQKDPMGRRHLVTAWNPEQLSQMALPPCHIFWQCYVSGKNDEYLSLKFDMRSADIFLGVPFNISSYGLLLCLVARAVGKAPKELIASFGDLHLYKNHFKQAKEQLSRRGEYRKRPTLLVNWKSNLWDYEPDDFELHGYDPLPAIPAPVAV
jgi:thymidylate synthase